MALSGEKLTTRLRVQSFTAMMSQDIAWFDKEENTTGSLSTMLALDAKNVKAVWKIIAHSHCTMFCIIHYFSIVFYNTSTIELNAVAMKIKLSTS